MAREILFKAKTEMIVRTYNNGLDDGEWVQGYLRCDCGMWLIYQFEYDRADQVAYEVNPNTICQFTGLLDKNGNKIWENDVVEAWSEGICAKGNIKQRVDGTWIMYPCWQNQTMWYLLPNEQGQTTVEVIGNVFDGGYNDDCERTEKN